MDLISVSSLAEPVHHYSARFWAGGLGQLCGGAHVDFLRDHEPFEVPDNWKIMAQDGNRIESLESLSEKTFGTDQPVSAEAHRRYGLPPPENHTSNTFIVSQGQCYRIYVTDDSNFVVEIFEFEVPRISSYSDMMVSTPLYLGESPTDPKLS